MLSHLMDDLRSLVARILNEDSGQGLAEYALILAFIAVVAILAVTLLGSNISQLLSKVATSI